MKAYCYASGLIEFGNRVPSGALPIARGPEKKLSAFIEVMARHGYSTKVVKGRPTKIPGSETLLVPGVPESQDDQSHALDAFQAWLRWIAPLAPKELTVLQGARA